MKRTKMVLVNLLVVGVFCVTINFIPPFKNKLPQQNHAPTVTIVMPKSNSQFDRGTRINYSITVSDKEDGDSKYDEINVKEVLLQVKYAGNKFTIPEILKHVQKDPDGLGAIRTSNCFNCHAFNAKSIGPSFYEINKKYPTTNVNIALLAKRIHDGSTGVWGKTIMPTHPELSNQETQKMVRWILQNSADPNNSYYTGTEGTFIIPLTSGLPKKAAYILIASYTDHGTKNDSTHRAKGQDAIIIQSN